jgi:hypothetical protein
VRAILRALRAVANAVAPVLGPVLIRAWGATLRTRVEARWHWTEWRGRPGPAVLAFWHDGIMVMSGTTLCTVASNTCLRQSAASGAN